MSVRSSRRTFLRHAGILTLSTLLAPKIVFPGGRRTLHEVRRSRVSMGSLAEIRAYGPEKEECVRAISRAFGEFDRIEKLMSVFDSRSQLSRINQSAGRAEVEVDRDIIDVLQEALEFHHRTLCAFDVTIEPLMELYGFRHTGRDHRFPSDKQIAQVLGGVGMDKIDLNPSASTVGLTHPLARLDFGGIAVGYAIDSAVSIMKNHGVESALINHSGDIFAIGTPPEEDFWEIGITDPVRPEEIVTTVRIKDQALSTSGNYRNFVEDGGLRIGHILDPKTGKSASSLLSLTVVADRATEADALATGVFVMGLEGICTVECLEKNVQLIAVQMRGQLVSMETSEK